MARGFSARRYRSNHSGSSGLRWWVLLRFLVERDIETRP